MSRYGVACDGEAVEQHQSNAAGGDAGFHCRESALNALPVVLPTAGCSLGNAVRRSYPAGITLIT